MPGQDHAPIIEESRRILDMIARRELAPDERRQVVEDTVYGFREHINPGFLEYRKSVSTDYTAVEWEDEAASFKDIQGREFIDCLGGYGIYNCGHRHPRVVEAVVNQLKRQALHSQELLDPLRALLARLVADLTPGDLRYSFFTCSGTESVEGAMKLARLYTRRPTFVAAINAYHGMGMGSLSLTSKAVYRQPFLPLLPYVRHVTFGDAAALEETMASCAFTGEDVAAVFLEPVQGEGGARVAPEGYLQDVRALCDRYGALLVLDEVQTGMGRTGKVFACEHWEVVPDILCLGKAFGGGVMPIGAFVANPKVWEPMCPNPFIHISTFGGNPISCAAAIAAINVMLEERLPDRAAATGTYFLAGLRKLVAEYPDLCLEARGLGLLLGIEFHSHEVGYKVAKGLFENGILVAGTLINAKTIRIEPPLIIGRADVDRVLSVLDAVLKKIARSRA
ncbi:MAG TPA: putrescine aminotransferase [Clostridiales bacterium]|nr:putrescine aminotransferase [Clostridiales bacterium]